MSKRAVEVDMFGNPFEEKPRAGDPVLCLDDWSGRTIRRLMIKGEPWWVGADVCRVLGLGNASQTASRLPSDEKGITTDDTLGGKQDLIIVNEAGLYRLIFTSRKDEAEAFKRWVFHEVLPSIRKTGGYTNRDGRIAKMIRRLGTDDPATLMARFDQLDLNKRLNRWLAEHGFTPYRFRIFHNTSYEVTTGKDAPELREDLGLKSYQTPLDRMGDVALSLHSAIKHTAMRLIRDAATDAGRELTTDEQRDLFEKAADAILGTYLAKLGFEYGFGLKDDPKRGKVLDLIRRQIESAN